MNDKWQKIVSYIRRTEEKCIVFDDSSGEAFVVMPVSEYKKDDSIRGEVKNDYFQEKINHDIAVWQAENEEESEDWDDKSEQEDDNDQYYLEPVE